MLKTRTRPSRRKGKRPNKPVGARAIGIHGDSVDIVRQVQAGFPSSRLAKFGKFSGLSSEMIAKLVAIPKRTLSRRQRRGRLRPDESDRLLRACRVFEMAVDLFEGNTAAAKTWLQTPQPGLGGAIPLDFASTDFGAREVEHLIGRLEYGVFS